MLLKYMEQQKEINISDQQKIQIEDLLKIKKSIYDYTTDFDKLLTQINKSKLLKDYDLNSLKYSYSNQINKDVDKFNAIRLGLFNEFKTQLPSQLVDNLIIENDKVNKVVDPIGFIGSSSNIKLENLKQYIEENGLIMFPAMYLQKNLQSSEVYSIINKAEKLNSNHTGYIIGTINNLDLNKILNEGNFELTDCIISKSSETILMSFLFQLPLLQSLNNEIQALKGNNEVFKNKVQDLQGNMEKFVNQQFKVNESFNQKISEIVDNLKKLNSDNLDYREEKRKENPTFTYTDFSTLVTGQYSVYISDDSYWGETEKVIKYLYHPQATALKEKSVSYSINHLLTNNNLSKFNMDNEVKLEDAKAIVQQDLKNNFVCVLAKDINNMKESAKVLCSFGTGYSPVTQLVFTQDEKTVVKEKIHRKGLK